MSRHRVFVQNGSYYRPIDIFNSLLSLSLLLALAINYLYINHSNSLPIGSLLDSASESDSKSNELKMSITSMSYSSLCTIIILDE